MLTCLDTDFVFLLLCMVTKWNFKSSISFWSNLQKICLSEISKLRRLQVEFLAESVFLSSLHILHYPCAYDSFCNITFSWLETSGVLSFPIGVEEIQMKMSCSSRVFEVVKLRWRSCSQSTQSVMCCSTAPTHSTDWNWITANWLVSYSSDWWI